MKFKLIKVDEFDDEEPVEIMKSDWFKEMESKITPAESLK